VPADEEVYNIMENTKEENMDGSSIVGRMVDDNLGELHADGAT
jgi:hypothetical protein